MISRHIETIRSPARKLSTTKGKCKSTPLILASPSPRKKQKTSNLAASHNTETEVERPTVKEGDAQITFMVGFDDDAKEFKVHKETACFYSSVLGELIQKNTVEGKPQTYRIDDTSSHAFGKLVHWLHTQAIETKQLNGSLIPLSPADEDLALAELWILAEHLRIPALQNATVEAIVKIANEQHAAPETTFAYIYRNTKDETCLLRQLVVRQCIEHMSPETYIMAKELFPKDLLCEIACCYTAMQSKFENKGLMEFKAEDFFAPTEVVKDYA